MTPTDAMVEKVARAIWDAYRNSAREELTELRSCTWDDVHALRDNPKASARLRELYDLGIAEARSAIAAYEAALNEAGLVVVPKAILAGAKDALLYVAAEPAAKSSRFTKQAEDKFFAVHAALHDLLAAASPAPKDTEVGE